MLKIVLKRNEINVNHDKFYVVSTEYISISLAYNEVVAISLI